MEENAAVTPVRTEDEHKSSMEKVDAPEQEAAYQGDSSKAPEDKEEQDGKDSNDSSALATDGAGVGPPILSANTPPQSMSAGADPWADPVVGALPGAVSSLRTTGDNPWATSSQTASPILGQSSESQHPSSPKAKTEGTKFQESGRGEKSSSTSALGEATWGEYGLPKLGHAAAKYWPMKKDFTSLNNGESYPAFLSLQHCLITSIQAHTGIARSQSAMRTRFYKTDRRRARM